MAVQYVGAIIGCPNKCGGIPKYERRYEIYEYIICMYRQHVPKCDGGSDNGQNRC